MRAEILKQYIIPVVENHRIVVLTFAYLPI